MLPEMPPTNSKWTWTAWAAAQTAGDPLKKPYTPDELTRDVQRAHALGCTDSEIGIWLHMPVHVVRAMRSSSKKPDPVRDEIIDLMSRVKDQAECDRLTMLSERTCSLLKYGIIDVADPQT